MTPLSPSNAVTPDSRPVSGLGWRAILAVSCAFALRYWFIRGGLVDNPMVGDAVQYCDYAWNLAYHFTFSMAPPGSDDIVPDGFRDPGYPLLLAVLLRLFGSGDDWYHMVLLVQALLGAASAGLAVLIAGRWLGPNPSLAVGLAVAGWPHNVAISGFLLSEPLFGFMVLLALSLLAWAGPSQRPARWAAAGVGFGAAAMVNGTAVLFGPLLALFLWKRRAVPIRLLAALLIGSMLLPGAWAIRGLTLQTHDVAGARVITNLVQGSWADYHKAYIREFFGDPEARQVISAINGEVAIALSSPTKWLGVAFARFARAPVHFLAWYAWKPELLWAWDIRVGVGDVYPYRVFHPIYAQPAMHLFEFLCIALNPLLFVLMVGAVVIALVMPGRARVPPVLYAVALLVAYETLVYTVLQSEPRYSIPFRPLQMMLAVTAVVWVWERRQAVARNRARDTAVIL